MSKKTNNNELNDKQKRFCEEYIKDFNGCQAYIRAGYSKNGARASANKLLTNTYILEYLDSLKKEVSIENSITVDFILKGVKSIALTGEKENDQLKAYEMLGKYRKMFTDNLNVKAEVEEKPQDLSKLTDEELEALAKINDKING